MGQPATTKPAPAIVVIGGGTGSFVLLQSLKELTPNITALVTMSDDGGSTGVLRDELGVLPPGDVRQCLVALSEAPQELRELFNFRFSEGTFHGHSFGNLFISAVEKMTNSFAEGVRVASDLLRITGRVLPVTLDNVRLNLETANGEVIRGEHNIDTMRVRSGHERPKLLLEPAARLNPEARTALASADMVVIAPGDLYTSLGPLLIVEGIGQALQTTTAPVVYVSNLVAKPGHTDGLTVADHAAEIERFIGAPVLDYVLYNTTLPAAPVRTRYEQEGEVPLELGVAQLQQASYQAIGCPLLSPLASGAAASTTDSLGVPRSFIRHDGAAVAAALQAVLQQNK